MPKQTRTRDPQRREPSPRRTSHPRHLQDLEAAAQADVDSGADDESQRDIAFGTGSSAGRDSEQAPVAESGLSVDPEDLGRQFLRGATDQDNFESESQPLELGASDAAPLGELISEATLQTAGQEAFLRPVSSSLHHRSDFDERDEPYAADVDLLSNVIHEASLFDRATEQDDTLSPRVESDETAQSPSDARTRAEQRERNALRRLRFAGDGRHRRQQPR